MKLATGTRLGPYAIDHAIGAGGMGVVYRADDSRLGRKVAIKLLPNAKGEYLRRFEREARTIGALNHPNLLTLYDVGEHDGTPFLVTELLDGESLRARLAKGALPLRTAVQIARDVARGLAAAHDAGVVHRDVKPDNIFLTTEGRTKILDFGIAKLRRDVDVDAPTGDLANLAHEPTVTPTTKDTGMVIGTPGYMAPEQLDGGSVDARTDIFALGVVLYEMICGRRAFASENAVEESYAILKTTPDPPKGATKAVARVVMRCLEKRPDARFQSATDLAFALDELDASTDPIARISKVAIDGDASVATTIREAAPAHRHPISRRWLAVTGLVAVGGVLGGVLLGRIGRTGLAQSWPTVVPGGPVYQRVTYQSQSKWDARLAPDGKSAVYSVLRDGKDQLFRSQVASPSMLPLGIQGHLLDISAKGELAVLVDDLPGTGGTLVRVVEGSGPRQVADRVTAAAWLPDEQLAVIRGHQSLEVPIGNAIVTTGADHLELLRLSPRADLVGFVDQPFSADTRGRVKIVDRSGTQLAESSDQTGIEGLAWSPDGSELWWSNSATIFALDRHGHERVVLNGVSRLVLCDVRAGKVLVAPTDLRLKMFTGPRNGPFRDIAWFDSPDVESVSADGQVILFTEASGTGDTAEGYPQFVRRPDQAPSLLTHGMRSALVPDGSAAIVISQHQLTRVPTGVGTSATFALGAITALDSGDRLAIAWSGKVAVIRATDASNQMKLWRFDPGDPATPPQPLPITHAGGAHPVSPDGKLIAIARTRGGVDLLGLDGKVVQTIDGPIGEIPLGFLADGTALFVRHLSGDAIELERIEIGTGQRSGWARIQPDQRPVYDSIALSADGEILTYSTNSDVSDLYVIEPPSGP